MSQQLWDEARTRYGARAQNKGFVTGHMADARAGQTGSTLSRTSSGSMTVVTRQYPSGRGVSAWTSNKHNTKRGST